MTRDYAHKKKSSRGARRQAEKSGGIPGWVWMFAGLAIGLAIAAVIYITRPTTEEVRNPQVAGHSEKRGRAPDTVKVPEKQPSRFTFYKELPDYEVDVSNTRSMHSGEKPGVPPKSAPLPKPGNYLIQAGSFRNIDDAQSQKANLALLNLQSSIETARNPDGSTWHRVRIGPLDNPQKVQDTLSLLNSKGIETLLMRVSG